jgi:hypothetical protein
MQHTDKIKRVQERWLVRRAFENAQDAALVERSFRDIGILMSAFQVSDLIAHAKIYSLTLTGSQMDTVLHVEARSEEIMQRLKDEDITRELAVM